MDACFNQDGVTLYQGDCRHVLQTLPAESIHCCVTSPPYFGLRDYGVPEQVGQEATPEEYIAVLVAAFREVRRVLREDGTLWLNLGDSYAQAKGHGPCESRQAKADEKGQKITRRWAARSAEDFGLKPKDMIGIPWAVAFALRADGWYLRSDIVWHKPNAMPESVRDRPTKAHEYIFLFGKSPEYYYDADVIREPHTMKPQRRKTQRHSERDQVMRPDRVNAFTLRNDPGVDGNAKGRNRRTVWTITTRPFKGAHFATFPPALVEPCVLAGCPVGGVVLGPFAGAATTGLVARQHGHRFIGIELNPEYLAIAQRLAEATAAPPSRPQPTPNTPPRARFSLPAKQKRGRREPFRASRVEPVHIGPGQDGAACRVRGSCRRADRARPSRSTSRSRR